VTRHFGESLLTALALSRHPGFQASGTLADIGSGAGFPGIPIKLMQPGMDVTLIESQNKKATFLREVLRALELADAHVFAGRAEQWQGTADTVTLRAVEQFARALPVAAQLVGDRGLLCLLIGEDQVKVARQLVAGAWNWEEPIPMPGSAARTIMLAQRMG
jgi:16S rRNA (guanine527-N7)-methyltransferase